MREVSRGAPNSQISSLNITNNLYGVGSSQKYYGHHDDMNRDHESKQSFSGSCLGKLHIKLVLLSCQLDYTRGASVALRSFVWTTLN